MCISSRRTFSHDEKTLSSFIRSQNKIIFGEDKQKTKHLPYILYLTIKTIKEKIESNEWSAKKVFLAIVEPYNLEEWGEINNDYKKDIEEMKVILFYLNLCSLFFEICLIQLKHGGPFNH